MYITQMAIADATLQHLAKKIKSKTLFITHYPLLATKLQSKFPMYIQNLHMGYDVELCINGGRRITFLYKVMPGLATGLWWSFYYYDTWIYRYQESFGIECARMAQIPEKIIFIAAERAAHMQEIVQKRASRNR